VLEAIPFGSIPRFTALKEHADVDVMAVLHFGKHIQDRKPSDVLLDVKNALGTGQAGRGRRNGQAVTVTFQSWPSIDVVPASRQAKDGVVTGYEIPDMNRKCGCQQIRLNTVAIFQMLSLKKAFGFDGL
jgi:hypothetical protein